MLSAKKLEASLALMLLFSFRHPAALGAAQPPTPQPHLPTLAAQEPDVSTALMQSTFEIMGPNASGGTLGTCFVVGKPIKVAAPASYYVLVTAAHVLESITGEQAIVLARQRQGSDWKKIPVPLRIRDSKGKALWTKNPNADVAAIYVAFLDAAKPENLVSTALFADDDILKQYELRPGDRVFILGYPLGFESPSGGFPILRAGWVASYPLVPSRSLGKYLVSFEVFKGNSGGPVYLVDYNRFYQGQLHIGVVHFFVGLVSEEENRIEQGLYSTTQYPLNVAVVIPASLIADTIKLLPPTPAPSQP
jgi:trypsin-like peptidase